MQTGILIFFDVFNDRRERFIVLRFGNFLYRTANPEDWLIIANSVARITNYTEVRCLSSFWNLIDDNWTSIPRIASLAAFRVAYRKWKELKIFPWITISSSFLWCNSPVAWISSLLKCEWSYLGTFITLNWIILNDAVDGRRGVIYSRRVVNSSFLINIIITSI